MGKGIAKFGYKSGYLPTVRAVLKKPLKPIVRANGPNVGYAEGIKEPKGVSRFPKDIEPVDIEQLIKKTIREPKIAKEIKSEGDKIRVERARLRREYFKEAIYNEQKKLLQQEKSEEYNQKRLEALELKAQQYEMSQAAKLTLPTISDFLKGPIMRQRTEEETQILQAKRDFNRRSRQFDVELKQASKLLELYYQAESFIISEDELAQAIEDAFAPRNSGLSARGMSTKDAKKNQDDVLKDALFGNTVNNKPDLERVFENLEGRNEEFARLIDEAVAAQEKLNAGDKSEAS